MAYIWELTLYCTTKTSTFEPRHKISDFGRILEPILQKNEHGPDNNWFQLTQKGHFKANQICWILRGGANTLRRNL